jgi:hypothetical protein
VIRFLVVRPALPKESEHGGEGEERDADEAERGIVNTLAVTPDDETDHEENQLDCRAFAHGYSFGDLV